MNEIILRLEKVCKTYFPTKWKNISFKRKKSEGINLHNSIINAVVDADLNVYKGEILGLLGPNGAGKSTILKMICGLIAPTSGKIFVKDKEVLRNSALSREGLGALIENPGFNMKISAIENLRYLSILQGGVSEERIANVVKFFDLEARIKDKVSTYSLGMLQRLGIAQAVMHKPDLLILDEPTNGLDPKWIIETRIFLKKLAKEHNMTILISSHILSEMQELCDRVAIINNGKIVYIKPVSEISESNDGLSNVEIKVNDNIVAIQILDKAKIEYYLKDNGKIISIKMLESDIPMLTKELVLGGVLLMGIDVKAKKLEDVFEEFTNMKEVVSASNDSVKLDTVEKGGSDGNKSSEDEQI